MSTSTSKLELLGERSALVVGLGGLGCPAVLALAGAGLGRVVVCDDDVVELTNLHRQVLFGEADVGRHKLDAAEAELSRRFPSTRFDFVRSRLLPDNARELVRGADVVIEGVDNFATKFLVADAAALEHKPAVHGAAIRWVGTVLAVAPGGRPCYRCLFEDVPGGPAAPNCAEAGVMGPVAGLCGALLADVALGVAAGSPRFGSLFSYDGKADRLRRIDVPPRRGCPLCGERPEIGDIDESRYIAPSCAA